MGRSDDRQRLARVFGFEPVKPWGALSGAALLAVIPWGTWIAGGAIALGVTAMVVDENRKIADGLREVETWGFPVTGYRDWLLANTPAFDLELRRDVAVELIAGSLHAVDSTIAVQRRSERVVRVVMRKIEMEGGERQAAFFVADRKRLHEVRDRVLGALHADVGIVAMRMGDADTLAALVASPQSTPDAAFRDQAIVAPPDLQSLAHAGTAHLRPPQEANSLKLRTDRLVYASGHVPTTAGAMTGVVLAGTIIGGIATAVLFSGAGVGFVLGAAAGAAGAWLMRKGDRDKLAREISSATHAPFPIEGYENWLLSGRPMFDIELTRAAEVAHVEGLFRNTKGVTLTWLSDCVVRVETDPGIHMAAQGIKSFWGGNPLLFEHVRDRILLPLAASHGIVAVRMGGYLDRKS